ncbi:MAG: DUF885 domain-containing protein [Bryobacteraceae bacterium]
MHRLGIVVGVTVVVLCGCSKPDTSAADLEKLTNDYTYGTLALSPSTATQSGYHVHNGAKLDEMLDDYSPAALENSRKFVKEIEARVNALANAKLDKEQQADLDIIKNNLALSLLELDTIQSYKHNPTIYVELIGNALFSESVLEYAPKAERMRHITKRIEQIPALLDQAKMHLVDAPEVWNRVAREENDGNVSLIDKTLRAAVPADQKAAYDAAATKAIAALKSFSDYLKNDLSKKTSDWRLGKEKYAQKFRYVIATGKTPEELLAAAEADLKSTREAMAKLAAPQTVEQALADVARQHVTPDKYMDKARETLAQATAFVKEKDLMTLPPRGNLQVIETPEFMRGIYGVAGFNPAPPLQPELGAFYWVTPIPKDWPKERVESKLREYNDFGIQEITIHEAMPGHYVQLEIANDVQPTSRRLLRMLWGNGPYIEGYAFYTQQLMDEAGYLNGSKALRLSFYKQVLRALANTILDIRLQTMGMTDQQALDLMMKDTYQEKEEATAKLQRAQLSSSQLPMYYSGWKGWLEVREHYKQRKGAAYSLKAFHDAALKESAVPLPVLDKLLE